MIPEVFSDHRICIVGLGYVGMTLAVAMADVGYTIVGIEKNTEIFNHLDNGRAHFSENGLDHRLASVIKAGRFSFQTHIPRDDTSTVFVITVGTPVGEHKLTKIEGIKGVAEEVEAVLKPNDLVILRSTVRVGVTRDVVKPILDKAGVPYQLAFCPERTIEGKAIEELRSLPQVVGGIDMASTLRAGQLFHMLTPSIIRVSSLEAAEMIKLVNNTHRDIMFAFANEIAMAAEVAGLSASEVIRAGNLGYPRGGVAFPGPVGGPCLEKDPYIFAEGLATYGFTPELSLAGRRLNERLPVHSVTSIKRLVEKRGLSPSRIAILGLAFKGRPETSDLRGSLAGAFIRSLKAAFPYAEIVGWDPIVPPDLAAADLGIPIASSLNDSADGSDILFIQTNHQSFKDLDFAALSARMRTKGIIYDVWGQNEAEESLPLTNSVAYTSLGSAIVKE